MNGRNVAASVRAKLLNKARAEKRDFTLVLTRYALERLLYRLSISRHAEHFLLKGALLFDSMPPQHHPGAVTQHTALDASFAAIGRIGPAFFPTQRGLALGSIGTQPFPVDAFELVVVRQARFPNASKHPRLDPFLKPVVRRRARAQARGIERLPLTPRAEHEQDRLHALPIRPPRPASAKRVGVLTLRNQRLDLLPQRIAQDVGLAYATHSRFCVVNKTCELAVRAILKILRRAL